MSLKQRAGTVWRQVLRRMYVSSGEESEVVEGFKRAYLASAPEARWMGRQVLAPPLDLWVYQEIVHDTEPEVILAVNTSSADYLADLAELRGRGKVISIEGEGGAPDAARHAAGLATAVLAVVGRSADADLGEVLRSYAPLVSSGSYLIVEEIGTGGRAGAVAVFMREHREYTVDRTILSRYLTYNGAGYLKRAG